MSSSSPEILNPAAEAMSSAARSAKMVTEVPSPLAGRVTELTQTLRQRPAPAAAIVFAILALVLLRRVFSQTAE